MEPKLPASRVFPPPDNPLSEMPAPVSSVLYGRLAPLYIREAVSACREVTVSIEPIVDALVQVRHHFKLIQALKLLLLNLKFLLRFV